MPIPYLRPKFTVRAVGDRLKKAKQRRWRRRLLAYVRSHLLPIAVIAVLLGGVFTVGVFAWYSRDLPNPDKVLDRTLPESTKIFARDGTTLLYEIHGEQKRTVIGLEEIPDYMKQATIAVEDKDFYRHPGFSVTRMIKAIIVNVLQGRKAQGASTITQQFIKNALLTSEKSYARKIREIVLAYQLEHKFSKDQILKLYLNEIPYGSSAYGVESASQTFFGKSAKDLTLSECALLAALPQAPSFYSPYGSHTDDLVNRQKVILNLMVEQGYITKEQAEGAKKDDVLARVQPKRESILAPHFVFYVKELLSEKYGEKIVEQGGLKVITTLNIDKQRIAEEVIAKYGDRNEKQYKARNAGLVSIDTKTGQVLAMVGSRDYFNTENDGNVNVTIRPRQPGSSFKPFVYLTAFKKGYTPETILFDLVTKFKTDTKDYEPHNYDSKEHGPLTMRQALAGSLNIPAVKTLYLAGINNVLDTAEDFGYTTFADRSRYGLSLVLGGGEVTLLEHTAAYATLAREGMRHPTAVVLKVEDKNGKVLEEFKNDETRVIDEEYVRKLNSILSDNDARSFIFGSRNYLTLPDRPVAAKTGTTNDYRDAWTLGYTPSTATGVVVLNNDNSEMSRGADGSVVAAPIWQEYMKRTVGGPAEPFKAPKANEAKKPILRGQLEGETTIKVDKYTGKRIPSSCIDSYPADYIVEKTVRVVHDILFYVNKDDPNGPEPSNPAADPQFERWEEPVLRWAKEHGYLDTMPPEEECSLRTKEKKPTISITSPQSGETITTSSLFVSISVSSKRPVKKVEYLVDERVVGESTNSPFTTTLSLEGTTNGFHELTAIVHDAIENTGSTTISFNYLVNGSSPVLYIISPGAGATLHMSSFPYTVSGFAYDPSGVSRVDFFFSKEGGAAVPFGTINNPPDNSVSTSWLAAPGPGSYTIWMTMENNSDNKTVSDVVPLTVD